MSLHFNSFQVMQLLNQLGLTTDSSMQGLWSYVRQGKQMGIMVAQPIC